MDDDDAFDALVRRPPQPWMANGRCRETAVELMFPESQKDSYVAQEVCRGGAGSPCPVRLECLTYALVHGERFGVWGGYSERERRNRRKLLMSSEALSTCPCRDHLVNEESPCEQHTPTSKSA